jgi:hypothetical protein
MHLRDCGNVLHPRPLLYVLLRIVYVSLVISHGDENSEA